MRNGIVQKKKCIINMIFLNARKHSIMGIFFYLFCRGHVIQGKLYLYKIKTNSSDDILEFIGKKCAKNLSKQKYFGASFSF